MAAYLSVLFISVTCFSTASRADYIDESPNNTVNCYVDDQNRTIDCFPAQNRMTIEDDYVPFAPPPSYSGDCGGSGYDDNYRETHGDHYFGFTASPYDYPPYYPADTGPACGSYPLDNEINMPPDVNMPHAIYPADLPKPDETYSTDKGGCPVEQTQPTDQDSTDQSGCPADQSAQPADENINDGSY